MKLAIGLAFLVGTFVLACSSAEPPPVGPSNGTEDSKQSTTIPRSSKESLPTEQFNTPTSAGKSISPTFQTNTLEFGKGGLVRDLAGYSDVALPKFVTASHIAVNQIATVSKFRSSAGHDFSDSFEDCCSMKHYFRPVDYYGTRFSQPIYSPVNGVVLYVTDRSGGSGANDWTVAYEQATGATPPDDYLDWDIYIRPDDAPNVWVRHMHLNPISKIRDGISMASSRELMRATALPAAQGFRVKAGDLIGHGLGEISITRHLSGTGVPTPCNSSFARDKWANSPGCKEKISHHSIFELMTEEVFAEYRELSRVSRADFIITATERSSDTLACDGEYFFNAGNEDDPDVYVRLQSSVETMGESTNGIQETSNVSDSQSTGQTLPGSSALASNRVIIESFNASGSHTLSSVNAVEPFVIVIAAIGGPVSVSDDVGPVQRSLYTRGKQDGVAVYETPVQEAAQVNLIVEAPEDVHWGIVVVKAD